MNDVNTNPYAPPTTIVEQPRDPASVRSRVPLVFVTIGVAAYMGFTVLLLTSTSVDRQGGIVFLINFSVMLIWVVSVWKTDRYGAVCGVASAVTQGLVAAIMIWRGIGDDEAVYAINGSIIVPILLLSILCWWCQRRGELDVDDNLDG